MVDKTILTASTTTTGESTTAPVEEQVTTAEINIPTTPMTILPDLEVTDVSWQLDDLFNTAALPSGEAIVVQISSLVVKINNTGHTVKELYDCNVCYEIRGLLLLGSYLYVVHTNGTVLEMEPNTGELINVYTIPDVSYLLHYSSLGADPFQIPDTDILLLADRTKGEVISYKLSSGEKIVHLTGLGNPTSVSYSFSDESVYYVVCQSTNHIVTVYDSAWNLLSTIQGEDEETELHAVAAIVTMNNSVMVSDKFHSRISVFDIQGAFLFNFPAEGIPSPLSLSYYKPYLWVAYDDPGTNEVGLRRIGLDE